MSESFKFGGSLEEAREVFPNAKYKRNYAKQVSVYDEKQDKFVRVNDGDYIVKIGSRYEVTDKKPREAKKVTASDSDKKKSDDAKNESQETQDLSGSNAHENETASTPEGATSFEP